jgi:hypothetical protein
MTTIPASRLVSVTPSVVTAGGNALQVIALMLSTSTRVPIGTVQSFASAQAVSTYFGATAAETAAASVYFTGFTNSTATPGSLLFAQYNQAAVQAWLRGGNLSAITLATLQTYSGTLSIVINGVNFNQNINLSAATSFANAAEIIGQTLGITGIQQAVVTGSVGGTTMTVSGVTSGTLTPGCIISGSGIVANTFIVQQLSGTIGGVGTYQLSGTMTAGSTTITAFAPGVLYDTISQGFTIYSSTTGSGSTIAYATGALASLLLLTSTTAAAISQGAGAAVPAAFMNNVVIQNTNWVTFMTLFDPDNGVGNTVKQAFAAWKQTQNQRYAYVCWDPDTTPTLNTPAPTSLGAILAANGDSGTILVWEPTEIGTNIAAFVCGVAASINFNQQNGRITFAYKWQGGLLADVVTDQIAQNLLANGYCFGGAYGSAAVNFVNFQNGQCTGLFKWFDSYIDQIWLNSGFQQALLTFLQNALSVPYSDAGNASIAAALQPSIQAGLFFGAYAPGTISAAEANAVNAAAGKTVSNTLQAQGWYLQILPATSAQRAARSSPPCTFWYLDRGSVQQINLQSIEVQ